MNTVVLHTTIRNRLLAVWWTNRNSTDPILVEAMRKEVGIRQTVTWTFHHGYLGEMDLRSQYDCPEHFPCTAGVREWRDPDEEETPITPILPKSFRDEGVFPIDITAPEHGVLIVVRGDGKTIWVNVDGKCALRICRIPYLDVEDQREAPRGSFLMSLRLYSKMLTTLRQVAAESGLGVAKLLEEVEGTYPDEMLREALEEAGKEGLT